MPFRRVAGCRIARNGVTLLRNLEARLSEFGQNCEIDVQLQPHFDYGLGGSRIGLA
jgi:hypothetical protein